MSREDQKADSESGMSSLKRKREDSVEESVAYERVNRRKASLCSYRVFLQFVKELPNGVRVMTNFSLCLLFTLLLLHLKL